MTVLVIKGDYGEDYLQLCLTCIEKCYNVYSYNILGAL